MIVEEHSFNKIRILEVVLTIAFYGGKSILIDRKEASGLRLF
jgi:hypothetical protein